jgi:hypothetical protein
MFSTALLALMLALGGGAPHLGGLLGLASSARVDSHGAMNKAGTNLDPDGGAAPRDVGTILDPDGMAATNDVGTILDPNG